MARTAKRSVSIYDEGVLLGEADSIDFTGAGISCSFSNGRATENVNGGGSGGNTFIYNEIVSGSSTTFTLTHSPVTGLLTVRSKFGKDLLPTQDYTVAGAVLTMVDTWNAGEVVADYQY